jgi:hypothetical protein
MARWAERRANRFLMEEPEGKRPLVEDPGVFGNIM